MLIQMKTLAAGPAGTRLPGRQYDVEAKEGESLVAAGAATDLTPVEPKGKKGQAQTAATATAPEPKGVEKAVVTPVRGGNVRRTRG
jgi:hypothetical protein